jgi:hypothetical protein
VASLRKRANDVAPPDTGILPDQINNDIDPPPLTDIPAPPEPLTEQDASAALLAQIEAAREAEASQGKEARRREWVTHTPAAQQHYASLGALHHAAINSGLVDTSPEYFRFLEEGLTTLEAQQPAHNLAAEMHQRLQDEARKQPPPPLPRSNASIVSAPVSRDVPTGYSAVPHKVTLTLDEKEHARVAGNSRGNARRCARLCRIS